MKYRSSTKRFLALALTVVILIATLCSCSINIEQPYNDEVVFDTRHPDIAPAFTHANYDIVITMTKIIESIGALSLYEYTIVFDVYEKAEELSTAPCAHYVVSELFFSDREPYEVLDYHESPTLLPTAYDKSPVLSPMLQDIFDELAQTAVLISIRNNGIEYAADEIEKLMQDFKKDAIQTTIDIFQEYVDSQKPDDWAIVGQALEIFDNFPMPDSLTHNLRTILTTIYDFTDFVKDGEIPIEQDMMLSFMSKDAVEWIHKAEEYGMATITDNVVEEHKELLAVKSDAFAAHIIALYNES